MPARRSFRRLPTLRTSARWGYCFAFHPQEAVDLIGDYVEATGIERYYNWTVPPGYEIELMNEHLALFADEVMPHFKGRGA